MALRRLEPFDYLATADLPKRFTAINVPSEVSVSAGNGRNSTASLRTSTQRGGWDLTLNAQATWVVGFSWKYSVAPVALRELLRFFDTAVLHLTFAITSAGTIEVFRGAAGGTLIATSTSVLSAGTTYYLEFYVTIDDSVGVAKLRVNEVLDATLNFSGDTRNAGNATANVITYQSSLSATGWTTDQDDLYICDGTVGDSDQPNNDFLGDIRVESLLPSGAGATTQFTPSAGSNFQNVDDAAPNSDTDYNSTATIGNEDTFAMGNLATATGVVQGVELINYARKLDAGSSVLAPVLRQSGVDYVGSDDALGTGYTYQSDQVYDVNPATGLPFTISEVNALEAGYKKTA